MQNLGEPANAAEVVRDLTGNGRLLWRSPAWASSLGGILQKKQMAVWRSDHKNRVRLIIIS